jgi:hypothetical protein
MRDIDLLVSYTVREAGDIKGLAAIAGEPAQIAINSFDSSLIDDVYDASKGLGIDVRSIHLRRLKPEDAVRTLLPLRDQFGVHSYTLHEDKRTPQDAQYSWAPVLSHLDREDIRVGFENGRKTGSWLKNPFDLPSNPLFQLVLDTGHLTPEISESTVLERLEGQMLGIHLTAEPQGPYKHFERILPWMFQHPDCEYVLEYGRDNIEQMLQDRRTIGNLHQAYVGSQPTR